MRSAKCWTAQQIEAAPSFGSGLRDELLQAMGKLEGRLVIVLDRARLRRGDDVAAAQALPVAL